MQWTSKEPANSETGEDNSSILSYLTDNFDLLAAFLYQGETTRDAYINARLGNMDDVFKLTDASFCTLVMKGGSRVGNGRISSFMVCYEHGTPSLYDGFIGDEVTVLQWLII